MEICVISDFEYFIKRDRFADIPEAPQYVSVSSPVEKASA